VTKREIYAVFDLFMITDIIQKLTVGTYCSTKGVISTLGFGKIKNSDTLELTCIFFYSF
jgi:hypothetical protein